jgi:hypothetical protein
VIWVKRASRRHNSGRSWTRRDSLIPASQYRTTDSNTKIIENSPDEDYNPKLNRETLEREQLI